MFVFKLVMAKSIPFLCFLTLISKTKLSNSVKNGNSNSILLICFLKVWKNSLQDNKKYKNKDNKLEIGYTEITKIQENYGKNPHLRDILIQH